MLLLESISLSSKEAVIWGFEGFVQSVCDSSDGKLFRISLTESAQLGVRLAFNPKRERMDSARFWVGFLVSMFIISWSLLSSTWHAFIWILYILHKDKKLGVNTKISSTYRQSGLARTTYLFVSKNFKC